MSKQIRGLGRGLDAILGDSDNLNEPQRTPVGYINKEVAGTSAHQNAGDVLRIPVDQIEPNPYQPRMAFDNESLEELADSIRTFGLIQPVTVRKKSDGRYQIISGERRYKACRLVGMDMIPAYIREANDQGMLEMAIVENIQRQDLDPIEVAMSYQRLIDECSLTQEEMADRVGKKRTSITNYLRLLKLPAKVQHDIKVGLVSVGHAKVLLGVEDPKTQELLCNLVINNGISVRQLEEKVRLLDKQKPAKQKASTELPDEYYRVLEHMGKFFENSISLKRSDSGKGTMTIRFSSDEEIRKFLQALEDKNI
ncbi:MAG: ParB/RepB/Spo0J family partition protein [Bacteroidales bacterium]|jgi:ParB family chromosome partitioning protein|nr:ParB/RepB/Spo0J family partition protein [Bacteroidales bacterium]MDY2935138.1 ParB/RepB/Spo0J family partition protein [Candidatus Cryptobacteroides sp.]MCH3941751.1 ParB/RepB/Spo0J family partition protein [Bacteroidales bacterium]MCI2134273.1 ParB/RepB/Spo0J family partition protein [Bacteroidales bacterium]MCI2136065.1 ParB/RepB/Spo0J family partition protein [Bacteroidales bacterium]